VTQVGALPNSPETAPAVDHSRPLRVALVSSSSGSKGGGELYLVGLAQGLAALGHEILCVLSDHARMDGLAELLEPHGSVHRLRFQNTYDRRLRNLGSVLSRSDIRRLTEEFSNLGADVIHLNKQNTEDGLDLLQAGQNARGELLTTIHVTRSMRQLQAQAGWARDWITNRVLRSAPWPIITTAKSSVEDLARIGISRDRVHLVYNGVADAPRSDREAVRGQWDIGPAEIVLGCVARLEPQKNPLFLPPLLRRLPAHVRLVWIGDGSLMEPMRKSAAEHGVTDRIVLPGWQHDARSMMAGFDVFVLPSIYEGFPFAILEAMAAGLPTIASDVDGVGESVSCAVPRMSTSGSAGFKRSWTTPRPVCVAARPPPRGIARNSAWRPWRKGRPRFIGAS
jgi:glycosyltransferase involved in cell wall biosynthesis